MTGSISRSFRRSRISSLTTAGLSHILNVNVDSGATANFSLQGTQTYSGIISGAGNVLYSAAYTTNSTLTLTGNNTYTGTTTINGTGTSSTIGNTIVAGYATHYTNGAIDYSPFGASPSLIMNNVQNTNLNIGAYAIELNALSGGGTTGGNINLGTGTLTVGAGNTNTTYSGVFSSASGTPAGGLIKTGTGTLTLSGSNTYNNTTTINGGTLTATAGLALGALYNTTPSLSAITVNSGGTLNLQIAMATVKPITLNGGTLQNGGASAVTHTGAISLTADSFINTISNLTLSGIISNSGGTYGLSKSGNGTLTLSGNNTFGGNFNIFNINAGTVVMSSAAAFGDTTNTVTVNAGTFLDVQTTTSNAYPTVMNGGSIGNSSAVASVYSGALTLQADTQFNIGSTGGLSLTGAISGNYGITKMGSGTGGLGLNAANSYTGVTTISTGFITLAGTAGDFGNTSQIIDNGNIYYMRQNSLTISAPISGTGGIVMNNMNSSLTLAGANTFTGLINMSGVANNRLTLTGSLSPLVSLNIANTSSMDNVDFSSQTSPVTLASLSGSGSGNNITLGSGGLVISGGTTTYLGWMLGSGPLTINGNLTMTSMGAVASTIPITIGNTGSLTLSGIGYIGTTNPYTYTNLLTNNGTFRYSNTSYNQVLSGGVTGSGNIIKDTSPTGLLTITGTASYTGTTTINAGTMIFGGATVTGAAVTLPSNTISVAASATLAIGNTTDLTVSNTINGAGNFQKWGPNILTIAGTVGLSGTTTVSYGTLKFGNAGAIPTGLMTFGTSSSNMVSIDLNGLTYGNNFSFTCCMAGLNSG